jgi:toxin ParE1/3/4
MPSFRLSRRADADLSAIADYTVEAFAIRQARRYRTGLKTALHTLARNPSLGRPAEEFAPNLRRFEYQWAYYVLSQGRKRHSCAENTASKHGC